MIPLSVGGGRVDVLPVVNGLASEAEKVRSAYGKYEAYGASMGIEALDALSVRDQLDNDDIPVSELDIAYSKRMSVFGDVIVPSPAFCELVDQCAREGKKVIGLDFKDYDFDSAYLDCVKATEFTSEHRLAKKGLKKRLDESSPEALAIDWDRHVSSVRGYARLNERRERHIAEEIASTMKYRGSLLAVIEVERADGVVRTLREEFGAVDYIAPSR